MMSRARLHAPCPPLGAAASKADPRFARLGASAIRATVLLRVTNFADLRREHGLERVATVMAHVGECLAQTLGIAAVDSVAADAFHAETVFEDAVAVTSAVARATEAIGAARADEGVVLAVGAAHGPDSVDLLDRIEHAEQALADSLDSGSPVIVDLAHAEDTPGELMLAKALRGVATRDELFVVYQPKIAVRQGTVAGAEALIRWQHPHYGLIMPDVFIPVAERSDAIRDIALWTLRRVIDDQAMLDGGRRPLRIFINVSGRLLTDPIFIDSACELVQSADAEIGFEITETSVIRDPDLAIANLERCAAIGITLAIDDYGAGLSSLSYLKRLPARELKIDKMFVTQLTSSHRDPLIVRSTIDLAHALDMEVTAEGVETPAALALLTVMGCEMVQGYLISAPLPFAAFKTYLQEFRFEAMADNGPQALLRPDSFWKRA